MAVAIADSLVSATAANILITYTVVRNCTALEYGGAVVSDPKSNVTVSNSTFEGNSASKGGIHCSRITVLWKRGELSFLRAVLSSPLLSHSKTTLLNTEATTPRLLLISLE